MIRSLAPLVGTFVLSSLAAAGPPARAGGPQAQLAFNNVHCDTPVCNCTSAPVMQELCYESGFEIVVGGEVITVKTGFSSSECLTVTILPDKCVRICYVYRVVQSCSSWWWGCTYSTVLLRTRVEEFDANCPPAPVPTPTGGGLTRLPLAA